jgi:O-antigen ligase
MYMNIIRVWLTGILVFIPFQHRIVRSVSSWNSELSDFISYMDETTIVVFLMLAIREYYKKRYIPYRLYFTLFVPFLVLIASGLISGIVNKNSFFITALGTFDYTKNFLVIFIYAAFFREFGQLKKIFNILLIVAVFLGVVAFIQELWTLGNRYILGKDVFDSGVYLLRSPPKTEAQSIEIWRLGISRAHSLMHHPNMLGLYSLLILTLYLSLAKRINSAVFIPLFTGIFLSISKMVYTGFLLVVGLNFYRKRWFIVFFIPLIILIILITVNFNDLEGRYWASEQEKMSYREHTRHKAIEIWKDYPFWGVGPGLLGGKVSVKYLSPIYDEYDISPWGPETFGSLDQFWPQILAEMGIVGTVSFTGLLAVIFIIILSLRQYTASEEMRSLFTGLAAFTMVVLIYTTNSGLNLTSILFTYTAFAGMGLGCSNKTDKLPIRFLGSFFILLVSIPIIFSITNPFNNRCVKGNCSAGKGIYVSHSGIMYKGEWKNGKRHGQGTWTHPNGYNYIGKWKNSKRHGQGTSKSADGVTYTGEWKSGKKQGVGTLLYQGGSKYQGEWKNGKRHGQGTWTHPNGYNYIGEWKNGKRHGHGTMTYPDGKRKTGKWEENRFTGI